MFICKDCFMGLCSPKDDFGWELSLKSLGNCEQCSENKLCGDINFKKEIQVPEIQQPTNSTTLALYLLLMNPMKGVSQYEAVLSDKFFKFSTRVSDLILKFGVSVHKADEDGENRFGHPYQNKRYCLYSNELGKNIEIYNRLNSKK